MAYNVEILFVLNILTLEWSCKLMILLFGCLFISLGGLLRYSVCFLSPIT